METEQLRGNLSELQRFCEKFEPQVSAAVLENLPREQIDLPRLVGLTGENSGLRRSFGFPRVAAIAAGAIFNTPPEKLISAACSVEYIRLSGAMLDAVGNEKNPFDLDDRRLLAGGLSLLNQCYAVIFIDHFDDAERAAEALREIVECVGAGGLVAEIGQIGKSPENSAGVKGSFDRATSPALLRLSLRLGAILGGADYMDLANFSRIAEVLSEAYSLSSVSGKESENLSVENERTAEIDELVVSAKRLLLENFPSNDARSCLIQFAESLTA